MSCSPAEIDPRYWFEALDWAAGAIRAELERDGKLIGAYDTLMASQAFRRGMTLVTANVAEFDRVAGLRWENWAKG